MDSILDGVFEMWQLTESWKECCEKEDICIMKEIKALKKEVPEISEEQVRDCIFGIAYEIRKNAFRQGVKCAMEFQRECMEQ